jgi:hypothetical protein
VIYLVSIGDKMKKKILLPAVFLISFLFSGCLNFFPAFFGSFYYSYDFDNKKNKNVTSDRKNILDGMAETKIIIEGIKFIFSLDEDYERSYRRTVKSYYPWFCIRLPEGKYIAHVFINRVAIYAGETEYSMLKRVQHISLSQEPTGSRYVTLTEEEMADVRRTGFIEHTVYADNEGIIIDIQDIFVIFNSVPIDPKYKEVRMLFDISVEYMTGEIITINQEVTGLLRLKKQECTLSDYIWYPSV